MIILLILKTSTFPCMLTVLVYLFLIVSFHCCHVYMLKQSCKLVNQYLGSVLLFLLYTFSSNNYFSLHRLFEQNVMHWDYIAIILVEFNAMFGKERQKKEGFRLAWQQYDISVFAKRSLAGAVLREYERDLAAGGGGGGWASQKFCLD